MKNEEHDGLGPIGVISAIMLWCVVTAAVVAGAAFGWVYLFREIIFK